MAKNELKCSEVYISERMQELEYEMTLKSAVTIDEELNNRYFAGLDEKSKIEIQEIIEEYGLE